MTQTQQIVSETEMRILAIAQTPMSGREIARAYLHATGVKCPYGTLYTTLHRLALHGLMSMGSGAGDGRTRSFSTSDKGRETLDWARKYHSSLAAFGTNPRRTA